MLVKAGTESGTDKATATAWSTSYTYVSYGGITDLWGNTLSPADVNAVNFGFSISAQRLSVDGNVAVDHIRMTVYYTPAAPVRRRLYIVGGALRLPPWVPEPFVIAGLPMSQTRYARER
jgi:hypothetical protein